MLKVGFIGCGGFVQGNHLPNTAANPGLEVHALCDLNTHTLLELSALYEPRYITTNVEDIFADPELDMVVIGTKPDMRLSLIGRAAQAGLAVYVEKPLSLGWEESLEILALLRQYPVPLQVGFNRPYSPIMQEARRIFRRQRGPTTMISYRICGEFILFPQHHKDSLTVEGESGIVHEACHVFDLLNWFTESDPLSIHCSGGANDDNIIVIEYPHQTHAVIIASNLSTEGFHKERMEVFTNYSALVMDDFVELQCTQIPGEKDQLFPLKSLPGGAPQLLRSAAQVRKLQKTWREGLTAEQISNGYYYDSRPSVNKGHYEALEYFRARVVHGEHPETDAWRGAVATAMGLEALRSLGEHRRIDFDFSPLSAALTEPASARI